jgi:hypothetical protein
MISLSFEGWFQARLATDPDPFDEKRGVSGWTAAVRGEPDLDRIIRFRDPVARRSHGPEIGVTVTSVASDGRPSDHPLLGAAVNLLDDPVFEGRDGAVAPSTREPIVPFHIELAKGNIRVGRQDDLDINDPVDLARRLPVGFQSRSPEVAVATGIVDPAKFRHDRSATLEEDLRAATDPAAQAALRGRLRMFRGSEDIRTQSLGFQISYRFSLRGAFTWTDPDSRLGAAPDGAEWPISFWMGGWDADALSGFVKGALTIP